MLRAYARVDLRALTTTVAVVQTAPRRLRDALPDAMRAAVSVPMVAEISTEPAEWKGKRRWKSERQRIFVITMLRKAGNLPYKRTHALAKGWRVLFSLAEAGGEMALANPSPVMRFVAGSDAQPMHIQSGWPQLAPTVAKYQPIAVRVLVETWQKMNRNAA
jgi:hypothetical protein